MFSTWTTLLLPVKCSCLQKKGGFCMLNIEKCIFFYITCQRGSEDPNSPMSLMVSLGLLHCGVSRAPHYVGTCKSHSFLHSHLLQQQTSVKATAPAATSPAGSHLPGGQDGASITEGAVDDLGTSLAALPLAGSCHKANGPRQEGSSLH